MKLFNKAAEAVKGARAKAAGVGAGLMVAAGSAMATPTAGFDTSGIVAKIEANTEAALLLVGAFILGVWTLRSMGLLKRG